MEKILNLASQVVQELKRKNLFITTVESCTGGGLSSAITNIPGASEVMKESFVTYSNEAKIKLGVPAVIIDDYSVYSIEAARAMAEAGLQSAVRANIAVAITGSISREDPNNPNSQPGVIYVAVKNNKMTYSQKFILSNNTEKRWIIKNMAIVNSLKLIIDFIDHINKGE